MAPDPALGQRTDRVRIWRNPHVRDTLFLSADFRAQRFDRHYHEEFAIGIIEGGCQAFEYDRGRRLDMPKGTVALISPGVVHSGWPGAENGWRYRMLYPAGAVVRAAAEDVFGTAALSSFNLPVVQDEWLFAALARLHGLSADATADGMEVEALYLSVIRAAFTRHAGYRPQDAGRIYRSGLDRVRETLETLYAEPVMLDDLSRLAGLGKFQLLRQFKAAFGLPPHAYLRQLRVRRAHSMILSGGTLADVAAAVGFADQAHMTPAFRAPVGYTPGALARA
jgi:AraC-like DNA-binding protein